MPDRNSDVPFAGTMPTSTAALTLPNTIPPGGDNSSVDIDGSSSLPSYSSTALSDPWKAPTAASPGTGTGIGPSDFHGHIFGPKHAGAYSDPAFSPADPFAAPASSPDLGKSKNREAAVLAFQRDLSKDSFENIELFDVKKHAGAHRASPPPTQAPNPFSNARVLRSEGTRPAPDDHARYLSSTSGTGTAGGGGSTKPLSSAGGGLLAGQGNSAPSATGSTLAEPPRANGDPYDRRADSNVVGNVLMAEGFRELPKRQQCMYACGCRPLNKSRIAIMATLTALPLLFITAIVLFSVLGNERIPDPGTVPPPIPPIVPNTTDIVTDPTVPLNDLFLATYADTKAKIRASDRSPVFLVKGDTLVCLRTGQLNGTDDPNRIETMYQPATYHLLKRFSHLPVTVYLTVVPEADRISLSNKTLGALVDLQGELLVVSSALQNSSDAFAELTETQRGAQLEIMRITSRFVESAIISRRVTLEELEYLFARPLEPFLWMNTYDAAVTSLNALHGAVSQCQTAFNMSVADWLLAKGIVSGAHMPAKGNLAYQYLYAAMRLQSSRNASKDGASSIWDSLGGGSDAGSGDIIDDYGDQFQPPEHAPGSGDGAHESLPRVFYASNVWEEPDLLDYIATHDVDMAVGDAFFGNPETMHQDILSNATASYLDHLIQSNTLPIAEPSERKRSLFSEKLAEGISRENSKTNTRASLYQWLLNEKRHEALLSIATQAKQPLLDTHKRRSKGGRAGRCPFKGG